jgi:hypothetical protein
MGPGAASVLLVFDLQSYALAVLCTTRTAGATAPTIFNRTQLLEGGDVAGEHPADVLRPHEGTTAEVDAVRAAKDLHYVTCAFVSMTLATPF